MKVLNCFLDNRFGGPQRRAFAVAEKLEKHNIETVFLFNEKLRGHIPINGNKSFLLKHLQCITKKSTLMNLLLFCLFLPPNLLHIYKIIKSERIRLVHTNGLLNLLPVIAAKLSRAKVLWHLNDTITPMLIKKTFIPLVGELSDRIATAATEVRNCHFAENTKHWKKCFTLHAPVDISKFRRELVDINKVEKFRSEFNIRPATELIGTIGNINPAKGFEYFIQAAGIIKKQRPNARFIIVGAQLDTAHQYWQTLQHLVSKLNLQHCFIFTGFRENVAEILSMLDVFVLSSIFEACPIAVLEAMAMKVPVVATNVGGVSELVINTQAGLIVEPRNHQQLAKAVLNLLCKPKDDLEEMLAKAQNHVEKLFSLDIIAEKHKQIYTDLLLNPVP